MFVKSPIILRRNDPCHMQEAPGNTVCVWSSALLRVEKIVITAFFFSCLCAISSVYILQFLTTDRQTFKILCWLRFFFLWNIKLFQWRPRRTSSRTLQLQAVRWNHVIGALVCALWRSAIVTQSVRALVSMFRFYYCVVSKAAWCLLFCLSPQVPFYAWFLSRLYSPTAVLSITFVCVAS